MEVADFGFGKAGDVGGVFFLGSLLRFFGLLCGFGELHDGVVCVELKSDQCVGGYMKAI